MARIKRGSDYRSYPRDKQWKGMSQAVRSHKCDKATWFEIYNFRAYRGLLQSPARLVLELTLVP